MTEDVHKLGEVLRAAREAKGVDLVRVERETKIRERYLSALERGEYRELPGSVYTKGFLRNYGAYLELDPEYLIDLYRLETSTGVAERPRMPAPPRPLSTRRSRAFVLTPGLVVAALLTIMVGALVAYVGYQLVTFARTPELRITDPAGNVNDHPELTITFQGVTAPNARVSVRNLPENPSVVADEAGAFAITVTLLPGSNVVQLTARDPVTQRDSATVERTIVVAGGLASPTPGAVATLDAPVAGANLSGPVAIRGSVGPGVQVEVSARLVRPPTLTFSVTTASGAPVEVTPVPPEEPDVLTLVAGEDGGFAGSLALPAGAWEVTVTPATGEPMSRAFTVGPPEGVQATLTIDGGTSYLELDEDGTLVADVSGLNAPDGATVELVGERTLRIRVGNAGVVRIRINGIDLGTMGAADQVVEWRVSRTGG